MRRCFIFQYIYSFMFTQIMASSSIEVMGMGGDDMKVMLLDDCPQDEEMAKKMQAIIHSSGTLGHIIDTGPPISEPSAIPSGQEEVRA